MKLRVLALDYDGTIATDGVLHPEIRAAIADVRAHGIVVVLVTGRILSDLRSLAGPLDLFDAIVAENGAVLALPRASRAHALAPPVRENVLAALQARGLRPRWGSCVIELDARDAPFALETVRSLQLPLSLQFNRDRLMVLPLAVSKATGLREALRLLRLSPHNAVGVGDAENDHELLAECETGYAVAWGSPALQAEADGLVIGDGPPAIAGWIRRITQSGEIRPAAAGRRRIVIGRHGDGSLATLPLRGENLLITGGVGSGKSSLAGLICEQMLAQRYSLCMLDAEGDYGELEGLPGVLLLGGNEPVPPAAELARVLRHADVSVVVDLVQLSLAQKRTYVQEAMTALRQMRVQTGLPHRVVLDEAHYFLHDESAADRLDGHDGGYILVSYRIGDLHPKALAAMQVVLATRETDPEAARILQAHCGARGGARCLLETLSDLPIDGAVLLPGPSDPIRDPRPFRTAERQTRHVRHRHKYLDVPVADGLEFRFELADGSRGPRARSLQELVDALASVSADLIAAHIRRSDFSRWIADVLRDELLAAAVAALEERWRQRPFSAWNGAVIHAIHGRYHVADDLA